MTTPGLHGAGRVWVNKCRIQGMPIFAVAIDPAATQAIYSGSWRGGGVFESTDGGNNWGAVNTGLTSAGVYALAIGPLTPETVYAGTDIVVFKLISLQEI
jgi:hypothetical protein